MTEDVAFGRRTFKLAAGWRMRRQPCACAAACPAAAAPRRTGHGRRAPAPPATPQPTWRSRCASCAAGGGTCAACRRPQPPTGAAQARGKLRTPSAGDAVAFAGAQCWVCQLSTPLSGLPEVLDMHLMVATLLANRPSCYNCGEGGHTAPECRREKPIAVRNERQPGYSERSVTASYYGYDDDYGGYNGYATPDQDTCLCSQQQPLAVQIRSKYAEDLTGLSAVIVHRQVWRQFVWRRWCQRHHMLCLWRVRAHGTRLPKPA